MAEFRSIKAGGKTYEMWATWSKIQESMDSLIPMTDAEKQPALDDLLSQLD